jgi:hypothetical protein
MSSLLFLDVYVCSVETRVIDVVGQGRGAMAVTTIAASGICVEVASKLLFKPVQGSEGSCKNIYNHHKKPESFREVTT